MDRNTRAETLKIRKILNEDWDPIGGVPADEYDNYVWPVCGLLIRGETVRAEVEAYLRWAADEHLKCPVPDERLDTVVDKLMALKFA